MVSRRKILNRSRDDLNMDQEEEDIWFSKDKLYKEHIQEVLDKWTQIDDEIWAKVIVFERNRRVAKAYARVPVLTVNGSDDGFDGMRIGLCGFENPMRDAKTAEIKRQIGQGVKIKMDDAGNVLLRRYAKSNVYIKSTSSGANEETAIGADVLKAPNQCLEIEKVYKIFDMKKFQANVNRELSRAYPDRRRLETQCLSIINFVKTENDILECPIWIMIINVVAMDMLKSKLPPVQRPVDIKNRPRIPIPDEDPYSEAGNSASSSGSSGGGSGSAGEGNGRDRVAATRDQLLMQTQQFGTRRSEKPPKLPPRDSSAYHHDMPKPDYDDIEALDGGVLMKPLGRGGKSDKGKDNKKFDDPYYCGLKARVPNFAKANGNNNNNNTSNISNNNSNSNSNNNSKSANGTVSEKKTSFFGVKKDKDKSKDKDKDKEKDKDKDKEKEKVKEAVSPKQRPSTAQMPHPASFSTLYQLHQMQNGVSNGGTIKQNGQFHRHFSQPEPFMWHAKSFESGIDAEFDPSYPIYGRLPTPARGYIPVVPRTMYVGDWE